jgi:hypothetical protein
MGLVPPRDHRHINGGDGQVTFDVWRKPESDLEARKDMRSLLIPVAALMLAATPTAALAKVAITVDKDNQIMTVSVDGVQRYQWPVSTGNPSHETPDGKFQTFRMEEDHFSKEFDDAPMPHSIFFTKQGHAIHGTFSEKSLGTPVSHGCVRISRANATTLYDLVKRDGLLTTTVTLTGSSRVALARKGKSKTEVARRGPAPGDIETGYDAAGNPIDLSPQARRPSSRSRATTTATSTPPTAATAINAIPRRAPIAASIRDRPMAASTASNTPRRVAMTTRRTTTPGNRAATTPPAPTCVRAACSPTRIE